jgi:hypothetical protein
MRPAIANNDIATRTSCRTPSVNVLASGLVSRPESKPTGQATNSWYVQSQPSCTSHRVARTHYSFCRSCVLLKPSTRCKDLVDRWTDTDCDAITRVSPCRRKLVGLCRPWKHLSAAPQAIKFQLAVRSPVRLWAPIIPSPEPTTNSLEIASSGVTSALPAAYSPGTVKLLL